MRHVVWIHGEWSEWRGFVYDLSSLVSIVVRVRCRVCVFCDGHNANDMKGRFTTYHTTSMRTYSAAVASTVYSLSAATTGQA